MRDQGSGDLFVIRVAGNIIDLSPLGRGRISAVSSHGLKKFGQILLLHLADYSLNLLTALTLRAAKTLCSALEHSPQTFVPHWRQRITPNQAHRRPVKGDRSQTIDKP